MQLGHRLPYYHRYRYGEQLRAELVICGMLVVSVEVFHLRAFFLVPSWPRPVSQFAAHAE